MNKVKNKTASLSSLLTFNL